MNSKIFLLSSFIVLSFCISCYDACEGVRSEQLFQLGKYPLKINTPKDTLTLGDSIQFRLQMPIALFDSISLSQIEIEEVQIGFYVTRDTDEVVDTSLIYIFDRFFDIKVNHGEMLSPYHFKLEKVGASFQLDFITSAKKNRNSTYLYDLRK